MNRTSVLRTATALGALLSVFASTTVLAQQAAPAAAPAAAPGGQRGGGGGGAAQAPMQIKQVTDGVYMVTGNGGNSTVRVTKDGVMLVDTKNPGDAVHAELMDRIHSVSQAPVKYVFITHHHNDHAGNTVNFLSSAKVISAAEEAALVARYTPANNGRKPEPPNTPFKKKMKVKLGGAKAVAYHFAPGHTGGDTIVFFPDAKVVAMGDELVATAPNCDYPFDGSVEGWLKSLDAVMKLNFDYAIPGHGDNPMTKEEVKAYQKKWITLVDRARAAVKAGTPKEGLIAAIKTDDLGWNINNNNWTQPARLDPFYAELSKMK